MLKNSRNLLISAATALSIIPLLTLTNGCHNPESQLQSARNQQDPMIVRLRWTRGQLTSASLESIVSRIIADKKIHLSKDHFELFENRPLAHMTFRMFEQRHPTEDAIIAGTSIRIWESAAGEILQVEADVVDEKSLLAATESLSSVDFSKIEARAATLLAAESEDHRLLTDIKSSFEIRRGKLLMRLRLRAARGWHTYWFADSTAAPVEHSYKKFTRHNHFAQSDLPDEYSIDARTFPIADAGVNRDFTDNGVRGVLTRTQLRHIKKRIPQRNPVRYFPWEARTFFLDNQVSSAKTITDTDLTTGMWSYGAIMDRLFALSASDAQVNNEIGFNNPARLVGRFASVYWHPAAARTFGINPAAVRLAPKHTAREGDRGISFAPFHYGQPLMTPNDGLVRAENVQPVEQKLPAELMKQGFDEIQTYDMVTTFFEAMQSMGLTDPELSTKPVNVVLYNPDVEDNAYSTLEGEINFGLYSSDTPSMARSNATGWHELGHELIGRLAHPELGGVASWAMHEGVSDFVAHAIIRLIDDPVMTPYSADPRPYNTTLFHLNNEVHDAGEAFGGSLVDLTDLAEQRFGRRAGTQRVMELVLETLRLIRGNPNLTEESWYEHMLYADTLPRPSVITERKPGELTEFIKAVFGRRNIRTDAQDKLARFEVEYKVEKSDADYKTISAEDDFVTVTMGSDGQTPQKLSFKVEIADGTRAKLSYPLTAELVIRPRKKTGVPVGPSSEQEFKQSVVIREPAAQFEFPLAIAAKCPDATPVKFENGKKIRNCRSTFAIVLTGNDKNEKRPANHQKRGALSLVEIIGP